ncbi:hypothetical protein IW22_23050 [Chryseobacterium sp. JM1]|nr:hypothetical protein IW22_23050 [Chryseobacterium sp. JM1]
MQGENFGSAFASGFLGSLGASAFSSVAGKFANSTVGTISFGAVAGGVGAELSGGNFWQGAVIGGFVAGLNHTMHQVATALEKDPLQKILDKHDIDPTKLSTQETLDKLKIILKKYWDKSAKWAEFATKETITQWEGNEYKGYLTLKAGIIHTSAGGRDYGITNPINGKVLLSTGRNNYSLAGSFIHEMVHSVDVMSGVQGFWNNFYIGHDYIESRAYMEEAKWTGGYINDIGQNHIINSIQVHLSLFNFIR